MRTRSANRTPKATQEFTKSPSETRALLLPEDFPFNRAESGGHLSVVVASVSQRWPFIVAGIVLAVLALVLLFRKRRQERDSEYDERNNADEMSIDGRIDLSNVSQSGDGESDEDFATVVLEKNDLESGCE
jgi:LPXTG-motif cell wall-anchored protein